MGGSDAGDPPDDTQGDLDNLMDSMRTRLRALLVTGGHPYEREPFRALIDSLDGIDVEEVQFPEAVDRFLDLNATSAASGSYDAFVFYDFGHTMPPDARRAFLDALEAGVGAVFLHHCIYNHVDWLEYRKIVGGFWNFAPFEIDGVGYGPSTAVVDQTLRVAVVGAAHPVTAGLPARFELVDEPYDHYYISPAVTPLLQTDHPASERTLAWAHYYGGAPVVYIQPGHGPATYRHPAYRLLLAQAIRWVARGRADAARGTEAYAHGNS